MLPILFIGKLYKWTVSVNFTGCAHLALCICSGCIQRCLSHYPPTEAPLPHLQQIEKGKYLIVRAWIIDYWLMPEEPHGRQSEQGHMSHWTETHQWLQQAVWCTHWEWSLSPEHEFSCFYWRYHFQWNTELHSSTGPWELTLGKWRTVSQGAVETDKVVQKAASLLGIFFCTGPVEYCCT